MSIRTFLYGIPIIFLMVFPFIFTIIWYLWDKLVKNRQKRNCLDCAWADKGKSMYILCYHPETALNPYSGTPSVTVDKKGNLRWHEYNVTTVVHVCDCWKWDRVFSNLKLAKKDIMSLGAPKKPKKYTKNFKYFKE